MTDEVQRRVHKDFPDYEIEASYPIALLRYHVAVVAKVMERNEITVPGRFVLRAVGLGVTTLSGLAELLGLREADLAVVGADLLRANLLLHGAPDVDGTRRLGLTMDGEAVLATGRAAYKPQTKTYHLLFDPLTGEKMAAADEEAVTPEQVDKEGLFTVPWRGARPTRGDISVEDVRRAAEIYEQTPDTVQVLSVIRLKQDAYPQYVTGVRAFILRHWETKERRYAVYRNGAHAAEVSQALQDLERRGIEVVPADVEEQERAAEDVWLVMPRQSAHAARRVLETDREIGEVTRALQRATTQRSATQNERERAALEARVHELEEQFARAQAAHDAGLAALEAASARVLREQEHRPLLEEALTTAQREVIVVSPWMTTWAVDGKLVEMMRKATKRGVHIRIAYGFGQHGRDADRTRSNAMAVRRMLFQQVRENLTIVTVSRETHEKLLVCDDIFAVATSFNWLSYSGPSDSDSRRETGFIVRTPSGISELRMRALELFGNAAGENGPDRAR